MTGKQAPTVTIPKAEHDSLLADSQLLGAMLGILVPLVDGLRKRSPDTTRGVIRVRPNPGQGSTSPIDRDPELAAFIRPLLGREPVARIVAICAAKFGPDRTPSKSAIHRFWQRCNALQEPLKVPFTKPREAG